MKNVCPHCPPTRPIHHFHQRLESFFLEVLDGTFEPLFPLALKKAMHRIVGNGLIRGLLWLGFLRGAEITPELKIHPRTMQVADEARERGWRMTALVTPQKRITNFFILKKDGRRHYFEGLPGYTLGFFTEIDHKEKARRKLKEWGIPTPQGGVFFRLGSALRFAKKIGFPLVVKPSHASLSRHVSINLRAEDELKEAIRVAKEISFSFIVEEFLEGSYFRATAIGNTVYAVCRRDAPRKPQEGAPGWKFNLDLGGTVTDVTEEVHPENLALFQTIAQRVKHPALGIDFIAPDISISWKRQKCGVIELNSLPATDLHTEPIVRGRSRNLAGALLDYMSHLFPHSR